MSAAVLPDWWTVPFLLSNALVLAAVTYANLFRPAQTFRHSLPLGWDKTTDTLGSSLRVRLTSATMALSQMVIFGLMNGAILFARNELRGMEQLQEKLVRTVVGVYFVADLILYVMLFCILPHALLFHPSRWNPTLRAMLVISPLGMAWKAVYLLGTGRESVLQHSNL